MNAIAKLALDARIQTSIPRGDTLRMSFTVKFPRVFFACWDILGENHIIFTIIQL